MDSSVIKVYDRELTQAEVLQNYNALAGRYGLAANTSGTAIQRTTSNTVLAEQFDEVTYNTTSPTIVNQTTYSQVFQNAAWSKSGTFSVTDNQTAAPDNTTTAALAVASGVFPNIARNYAVSVGQIVTYSIYAKYINQTNVNLVQEGYGSGYGQNINIQTGAAVGTASNLTFRSVSVGNGWYRLSITYTIPSGQTTARPQFRIGLYDGTNYTGSQVYIWGAQFEINSQPTIYQPIAAANTLVTTGMAQRVDNGGNMYVSNIFDEFTGTASVVDGLVAYYDPAYTSSYSGSGANLYNLVDGVAATLNGTYSASTAALGTSVSGTQTIRLTNSDLVTATNNISHIQALSFTNITTVSIWYYQHSYNGISRYIFDGRTGGTGGWIYNGSIGSNWTTGIAYVNGGASSGTPDWANWGGATTGVWKNVTFVASTPFTDDVNIFSRFTDSEGLDVTFGPILIYNRALTQAENAQNFNYLRNRFGI
jgi:hypothetical protein